MNKNLLDIVNINATYVHTAFKRRFPKIYLDNGAMCLSRLGTCIGFISALHYTGQQGLAEKLADNFVRNMEALSGMVEEGTVEYNGRSIDKNVVFLSDDGCPLSFTFTLYRFSLTAGGNSVAYLNMRSIMAPYEPRMHGGLIFHNVRDIKEQGEGITGWQIHT